MLISDRKTAVESHDEYDVCKRDIISSWFLTLDTGKITNEDKTEDYISIKISQGTKITLEVYNDEIYYYINDKPLGQAFKDFRIKNANVHPFVRFNTN